MENQIHSAKVIANLLKMNLPSNNEGMEHYEVYERILMNATTSEEVINALTSLMFTTAIMLQSNNK